MTPESREKIAALLDAPAKVSARPRQVNHPSAGGADVPVYYKVVKIGARGYSVALGRDMRPMAQLQQRLVEAQQSMEQEYARMRHAETRYRLLFDVSAEAVLIVDAESRKIVEANAAAERLVAGAPRRLVGESFPDRLGAEDAAVLEDLLAQARKTGRSDDVQVRLAPNIADGTDSAESADSTGGADGADGAGGADGADYLATASLFRQDKGSYFLIRLSPVRRNAAAAFVSRLKLRLLEVIESLPDGLVVTTPDGEIRYANRAFLELAQLSSAEQAEGQSLDRWLGRPGVDLNVLRSNLREYGSVRLFATSLRGEHGSTAEIEICAVAAGADEASCHGFLIRDVSRRLTGGVPGQNKLPSSVEQLTELVGRVPLRGIVRETTDAIEKLCIQAALELTSDNRASAAEMLGLSRQSLYVKLRRHGLADLGPEPDA